MVPDSTYGVTTASPLTIGADEMLELVEMFTFQAAMRRAGAPLLRPDQRPAWMMHSRIWHCVQVLKDANMCRLASPWRVPSWDDPGQKDPAASYDIAPRTFAGYPVDINDDMESTIKPGSVTILFGVRGVLMKHLIHCLHEPPIRPLIPRLTPNLGEATV